VDRGVAICCVPAPRHSRRLWRGVILVNHGRRNDCDVLTLTKAAPERRTPKSRVYVSLLVLLPVVLACACAASQERKTVPPEVESAISTVADEIAAERYEKVYQDAAELWRQGASLEESVQTFKTLRSRLGPVENRVLQAAKEQQNSGGQLKGRVYIVNYRTKFQNAEGMETFTLVERDGRWLLARYFVNSTALK